MWGDAWLRTGIDTPEYGASRQVLQARGWDGTESHNREYVRCYDLELTLTSA